MKGLTVHTLAFRLSYQILLDIIDDGIVNTVLVTRLLDKPVLVDIACSWALVEMTKGPVYRVELVVGVLPSSV